MKHTDITPLPWYIQCTDEDDIINIRARVGNGHTTHIVYMDSTDKETYANAAFIVKAVNNHDKMFNLLTEFRDYMIDENSPYVMDIERLNRLNTILKEIDNERA